MEAHLVENAEADSARGIDVGVVELCRKFALQRTVQVSLSRGKLWPGNKTPLLGSQQTITPLGALMGSPPKTRWSGESSPLPSPSSPCQESGTSTGRCCLT